jgi:two-component system, sensor histidine kinase SagS
MIRSLKGQMFLVIFVLVSILVVHIALSSAFQGTLLKRQDAMSETYSMVGLVHELERDIIDLQRNLLIYKETSTESSLLRFYDLMEQVEGRLTAFERFVKHKQIIEKEGHVFDRMRGHLKDYKDNFATVIDGRSKRKILYEIDIQNNFNALHTLIDIAAKEYDLLEVKYHLSLLEKYISQYLLSPDSKFIKLIKKETVIVKRLASQKIKNSDDIVKLLSNIKKKFIRLAQLTRGYLFLVNVVMAGSAGEFLYLTKEFREAVLLSQKNKKALVKVEAKEMQQATNVVSLVSITIALLSAWFLKRRVITPIQSLTHVFKRLSQDQEIDEVSEKRRNDEIGDLAKAADVFHEKNLLTSELLASAQDMNSQQEALNRELSLQKDKAEQAAKSKSMFLANMSHEIRTPMNGIIGLVDLTLKTPLTEDQSLYLNKVAFSGQIMMNVINDILDFSKIEAGKMDIESVEFSMDEIIENLISSISVKLEEKLLNLRVRITPTVPRVLYGDPLRISQVLLNLCNNSVKFTEQGGIEICVDYQQQQDKYCLSITVQDSGIGMSESELKSIFKSFTQADGSVSRKYGGTGLGLSIVKQLTTLMGGAVSVESTLGKGSCFKVDFDIAQASDACAIEVISEPNQPIYYVLGDKPPLVDRDVLSAFGLDIEVIGWPDVAQIISNDKAASLIMIDVSHIEDLQARDNVMQSLISGGHHVSFVIDFMPVELKALLREQWNLPILSHPYTVNSMKGFLGELLSEEVAKAPQTTGESEKIQFKGHVLLVEDVPVNQLVASHMIKHLGLTVDVVDNGLEAVKKVTENHGFDLVLMDVQMPVMDGHTATRAIRDNGFDDLIVCGLSANVMAEEIELAKAAGMNDYLSKPFILDDMIAMLKKYLEIV